MIKLTETQKKFGQLLFSIAPPIALQEVLNASVNMVDTLMIGRALGVSQVAAVGLANQITFLYILMIFGIISASGVFSGQFFGKGDIGSIHKIMGIGFMGAGLTALLFFGAAFFFPRQIISIYSQDLEVIEMSASFLRIVAVSYFIMAITFTRNAALRSMRLTKFPMITTAIALSTNVVLNFFAIFVLELGITGVAMGTVISRAVELAAQEFFIRRYKLEVKASIRQYFDFDLLFLRKFLKVGVFIIFNEVTWAVGVSLYNVAYGIVGTEAQGAVQISMAMTNLFQVFGNSLAISAGIIVSNTLGERKPKLAIKYAHWCIICGVAISLIMGGLFVVFSPILAGFYNFSPQVEQTIIYTMMISAAMIVFRTCNFIMIVGILRSGGDTRWCFCVEMITVYAIGVPLAFLGARMGLPVYLVFLLAMSDEVIKSIIAFWRILSKKWVQTLV
ncbi:MAG: MATE family efflux transporter [Turicibacter sp.]|nr:MATE family efflux transporter [Turicibacter sp.]